jgi:hypothetical protein
MVAVDSNGFRLGVEAGPTVGWVKVRKQSGAIGRDYLLMTSV